MDIYRTFQRITNAIDSETPLTLSPEELIALREYEDHLLLQLNNLEHSLEHIQPVIERVTVLLPESVTKIGAN